MYTGLGRQKRLELILCQTKGDLMNDNGAEAGLWWLLHSQMHDWHRSDLSGQLSSMNRCSQQVHQVQLWSAEHPTPISTYWK